jgi:hypothetical protein
MSIELLEGQVLHNSEKKEFYYIKKDRVMKSSDGVTWKTIKINDKLINDLLDIWMQSNIQNDNKNDEENDVCCTGCGELYCDQFDFLSQLNFEQDYYIKQDHVMKTSDGITWKTIKINEKL